MNPVDLKWRIKNKWLYRANPGNIYHALYQQELNMWGWWTVYQLLVLALITLQVMHSPLAFVLSLVVVHILGGFVFLIVYLGLSSKVYVSKYWN